MTRHEAAALIATLREKHDVFHAWDLIRVNGGYSIHVGTTVAPDTIKRWFARAGADVTRMEARGAET